MKASNIIVILISSILSVIPVCAEDKPAREDLDYRAVRNQARGREHDKIETPRGTIFYKVKIQGVYNNNVRIEHQDGKSILEYGSLPKEWIKEFNIEEKTKSRSSRDKKSKAPEFDLSGKVSVQGDINKGFGILVKEGDLYYVYTDCAVVSGNKQISLKSENGDVLEYGKYIECAEGVPLARFQVKAPGDDVVPVPLAGLGASSKMQAHQYLYPLEAQNQKKIRPVKFKSVSGSKLDLQSSLRGGVAGNVIMLGSKEAVGIVTGEMPDQERLGDESRYLKDEQQIIRLDQDFKWKKVTMVNYLQARERIQKFDQETLLLKAFSQCRIAGGKLSIPSDALAVFKSNSNNRNVQEMMKLKAMLDGKGMRVNEKEVQRKIDSTVDTVSRKINKRMSKLPASAFSWYHRHFFNASIDWRKSTISSMKK